MDDYNWNGNGSGFGYNGSVEASNGSLKGVLNGNGASNGSLVKYVNGNGAVKMPEEVKRKKTVEEIGQEDAWFKQGGKEKIEVITGLLIANCVSIW